MLQIYSYVITISSVIFLVKNTKASVFCNVTEFGKVHQIECKANDTYCCEDDPSGCCVYADKSAWFTWWHWLGVGCALLMLAMVLVICCYYASRSTFCRWLCWSASFSSSHIQPLLLKSDSSLSTTSSSVKSPPGKGYDIDGGIYKGFDRSPSESSSNDSHMEKTSCCVFPCCPNPASDCCLVTKFTQKYRKSIPWDDEETMMIPGARGRRRMGRPIHWVGSVEERSPSRIVNSRIRSLENVEVPAMFVERRQKRKFHRSSRKRTSSKPITSVPMINEAGASTSLSCNVCNSGVPSAFGNNIAITSMSDPHLSTQNETSLNQLTTGNLSQRLQVPNARPSAVSMERISKLSSPNFENKRYVRRRTTCLDSREASRIVQTLNPRTPVGRRRRKRRKRSNPTNPFDGGRSRVMKKYVSEMKPAPTKRRNSVSVNLLREKIPTLPEVTVERTGTDLTRQTLTRKKSGSHPNILESTYFDVLTQSSSDEDDTLHGRRRNEWFDIMLSGYGGSISSEESPGKLSFHQSTNSLKVPGWGSESRISPHSGAFSDGSRTPDRSKRSIKEENPYGSTLALFNVSMWMTEQMMTKKVKGDLELQQRKKPGSIDPKSNGPGRLPNSYNTEK